MINMADSPIKNSGSLVTFTLTSEGNQVKDTIEIMSLEVHHEVNRISTAILSIVDGDVSEQNFLVSESDDFKPGMKIKISAGYESDNKSIFEGKILKHAIKCDKSGNSLLTLECKSDAVKMTVGRKNAVYIDQKDSDIITTITGNYGLSSTVDATTNQFKEVVQYYATDWDFILSRAEINGMFVIPGISKTNIIKPKLTAEPVLSITFGEDIMEFDLEMDARYQLSSVKGFTWDPASQKVVQQTGSAPELNKHGNLTCEDLSKVIDLQALTLQTDAPNMEGSIKSWADAQMLKSGLSKIRGTVSFQGSADVMPGDLIKIDGVGNRFTGNAFVGSVNHTISEGDWKTEIAIGLPSEWATERTDISAPLASGFLPGIHGIHIGTVQKLDSDPSGEYKIQIKIPILQDNSDGIWARMASFYNSNSFGTFFLPEISDEVIVGFINNDPSAPVILGSVYSSKNKAPYAFEAKNNTKAIVTRTKMKIEMDEEKKVISILTPGNNKIIISDDAKSIQLKDQNSNTIEMNSSGILLDSFKDVQINAKGKISMSSVTEIDMDAKTDVKVTGLNISQTANVGFTAKGNATAELSAAGQTTVKGALVMIN
jgi:Rhs element Vgr protein